MTREEIAEILRSILVSPEHVGVDVDPSEIRDASSLTRDLKLDSVQTLEFVVAIENAFGFSLLWQELKAVLDEFGVLVSFVHSRMADARSEEAR